MWRDEQDILDDLQSHDVQRIAAGLSDLEERMDSGADEFPLPVQALDPALRSPADLPQDAQLQLLRLVDGYQSFTPPQDEATRYARIAATGTRWGNHRVALEAGLAVKRAPDPPRAAHYAIDALALGAIDSPRALTGAQYFVGLLLDGAAPVRRATLEALAAWPRRPPFSDVTRYILQQLEPAEAQLLQ